MNLYTIGSSQTSAESFFTRLSEAHVKKVLDIRLNNVSQLAGFSKMDDLRYFLRVICGIGYEHRLELAPTHEVLDAYRSHRNDWTVFREQYLGLIMARKVEEVFSRAALDGACLLCSEAKPDHCHRRFAAEYLADKWGDIQIVHL